jgi:hypothetical protein
MIHATNIKGMYDMWDELRARHPGILLDSCASGGRRIDLEVLSRAVILSRSDYEFGPGPATPGADCKLPADALLGDNTGDFEAEQSLTMGTFLIGAIPYGSPLRHYLPYASRSAGPAVRCAFFGSKLHSRMPSVHTPACVKRASV